MKIKRVQHYQWRAVDHEGEVLECYFSKKCDKLATLWFLKKAMKHYGPLQNIVTNKFRSYGAAMHDIGNQSRQTIEQYANNRAENSHNHSGDKNELLSGSGGLQPYRNSFPPTPRSTITSTIRDISKAGPVSKPFLMRHS